MALITADECRNWMKMAEGSEADAIIDLLVDSVSARCQKVAGVTFEPVTNAMDITGDGTSVLVLPIRPVIQVGVVNIEGGAALEEGWDKDFVREGAILRLTSGWWSARPGGNHVEWASGFELVPDEIKLSCWKAVAFDLKAQDKRREGVTSIQTADGANTNYTTKEYPDDVLDVWKSYRRFSIA